MVLHNPWTENLLRRRILAQGEIYAHFHISPGASVPLRRYPWGQSVVQTVKIKLWDCLDGTTPRTGTAFVFLAMRTDIGVPILKYSWNGEEIERAMHRYPEPRGTKSFIKLPPLAAATGEVYGHFSLDPHIDVPLREYFSYVSTRKIREVVQEVRVKLSDYAHDSDDSRRGTILVFLALREVGSDDFFGRSGWQRSEIASTARLYSEAPAALTAPQ